MFVFHVTLYLVVAVQSCMEWFPIKKIILLKLGGFSCKSLFYFFDDHKTFILHIVLSFSKSVFIQSFDSLPLFFSCNCVTHLRNSAILVCMCCFYHVIFLFSYLLLFFPSNYLATFIPSKINKFVSVIVSVWIQLNTWFTACVFSFTFFLSNFVRLITSKFFGSFIFSTLLIKVILFYPSINNSNYFSSYIHFNPSITKCIALVDLCLYHYWFPFLYFSWFLPLPISTAIHYFW